MLTPEQLESHRALAEQHGGKSGAIILELLKEIDQLSGPYRPMRYRAGMFSDQHAFPFAGPYQGVRLADVPDSYLWEWESQFDLAELQTEYAWASPKNRFLTNRKLMLYQYVKERYDHAISGLPEATEPQPERPAPEDAKLII
jgi:hypothetical protein